MHVFMIFSKYAKKKVIKCVNDRYRPVFLIKNAGWYIYDNLIVLSKPQISYLVVWNYVKYVSKHLK